jgi:O-antigen/teichoic acid export membrane protein
MLLAQARERADNIVIGRVMGAAPVGMFSVGAELGALPTTEVSEPLQRALFSGFATLHNTADRLGGMFLGAVGLGFLLILPAGVGISMVADPMVRLTLGEQWVAAVPVVQIMGIGGTTVIFTQACGTFLNAIGRPGTTFYLMSASTVVRIGSLLVLVPWFGLTGAALALTASMGVDLVLFLGVTLPRIDHTAWRILAVAIRPGIATLAMVAALWRLNLAWTPSPLAGPAYLSADLAIRCAIGALVYGVVLLAAWLAAGRPDGAERFILEILEKLWARVGRRPVVKAP